MAKFNMTGKVRSGGAPKIGFKDEEKDLRSCYW